MDGQNYLGIYLSKNNATVVCLALHGKDRKIVDSFSVFLDESDENQPGLAELIAKECSQRQLNFAHTAIAVDCSMFMQHNIHSEFKDAKQIAQTIRFDTEEALATDVSDVAIAFNITSVNDKGSDLIVYTAQKQILSDIITSLQKNGIDPVTIEPDINCLSRFICHDIPPQENQHVGYCLLSKQRGYFIVPADDSYPTVRTFVIGKKQDRGQLLTREIPMTMALIKSDERIESIRIFDSANSVNCQEIQEKTNIEIKDLDLKTLANFENESCDQIVGFVIALGAAMVQYEKSHTINFRNDFMPYLGRKIKIEKTIRFASIITAIVLLFAGVYAQFQLITENKPRTQLRKKFAAEYSAVMLGKELPTKTSPANKLKSELRRIENIKSGQLSASGEQSVSAKLTAVLEAFNKCAKKTDLNIDSISITNKNISIVGDTSNRKNTLALFAAIKTKMTIVQQRLDAKGGRDIFSITVKPKR